LPDLSSGLIVHWASEILKSGSLAEAVFAMASDPSAIPDWARNVRREVVFCVEVMVRLLIRMWQGRVNLKRSVFRF